ncbi:hypothetical protein MJO29_016206, partial [Puccinia striiformis f. sp. tritici]
TRQILQVSQQKHITPPRYILKPFDVIEHPTDNLKVGNNNGILTNAVSIGLNNIIVGKSNFIVDLSSYASCLTALTKDEECSLSREMMKKIKTNDCTVLYKQYTGSANPQTGSPDRLLRPKGWAAYQVIVVAVLQGYMQIGLQAHKIESRGPHKTSPRDLQVTLQHSDYNNLQSSVLIPTELFLFMSCVTPSSLK